MFGFAFKWVGVGWVGQKVSPDPNQTGSLECTHQHSRTPNETLITPCRQAVWLADELEWRGGRCARPLLRDPCGRPAAGNGGDSGDDGGGGCSGVAHVTAACSLMTGCLEVLSPARRVSAAAPVVRVVTGPDAALRAHYCLNQVRPQTTLLLLMDGS